MSELPPLELAKINEFGEAEAMANYLLSAPPEFSRLTRLDVKRIGTVVVTMIPALDHAYFNRILGLGVGEPATESILDSAIAVFQNAGCQNYMAQVSPFAMPAQCLEWLFARGFKPGANWVKMYRGSEPAQAGRTDLRVEKVGKEHAAVFADLVLSGFEMPSILQPILIANVGQPGWHHYLAFDGDKPFATASMFINGDVGWIGNDSTHKKYRRRGAQGSMFARRIQDGLALGCKWFVTETGEETPKNPNPSYHNMLRNGFQLAYLRRNYLHLPPESVVKIVRRAFFVAAYTLKLKWQRLK